METVVDLSSVAFPSVEVDSYAALDSLPVPECLGPVDNVVLALLRRLLDRVMEEEQNLAAHSLLLADFAVAIVDWVDLVMVTAAVMNVRINIFQSIGKQSMKQKRKNALLVMGIDLSIH